MAAALSTTMPKLGNIMIAESLNSSAHDKKRKTTPGQNWEKKKESKAAVNQYLQQIEGLKPKFEATFKRVHRGEEMHRRNLSTLAELQSPAHTGPQTNDEIVADAGSKLFGPTIPAASITQRSRSVLSPAALSAYTPVKGQQSPSAAIQASVIQQKRRSQLAQHKLKPSAKGSQMGYVETASIDENTKQPKHSPRINFPNPNINIGADNSVDMKRVKSQYVGPNRFDTGDKAVGLTAQVLEQWMDAVLKNEDEDGEPESSGDDVLSKTRKALAKAQAVTAK